MPKISGVNQNIILNNYDMGVSVGAGELDYNIEDIDFTSLPDSEKQYGMGLQTYNVSFDGHIMGETNQLFHNQRDMPDTDVPIIWLFSKDSKNPLMLFNTSGVKVFNITRSDTGAYRLKTEFSGKERIILGDAFTDGVVELAQNASVNYDTGNSNEKNNLNIHVVNLNDAQLAFTIHHSATPSGGTVLFDGSSNPQAIIPARERKIFPINNSNKFTNRYIRFSNSNNTSISVMVFLEWL